MTLEEAIHYAEEVVTWSKDYKRLRELETQPCEQQPCTDAISRSEAIRVASGYCHYTNIPDELAKLPSVTPAPKMGRWIEYEDNTSFVRQIPRRWLECSECGWSCDLGYKNRYDYCPNCGAKMGAEE